MSQTAKIVGYIGGNVYAVEIMPRKDGMNPLVERITVAHDYFMLNGAVLQIVAIILLIVSLLVKQL